MRGIEDMARARSFTDVRVAVLGYGRTAREHALRLRQAGASVAIGLRLGASGWTRALEDGLLPTELTDAVQGAAAVAILVADDEQPSAWRTVEPSLAAGALVVFGRGLVLASAMIDPGRHDVVLAASEERGPRIAVLRDETGHARERADGYARAVFGASVRVASTRIAAEVESELAELEAAAGGTAALLVSIDAATARLRDTHAPDVDRIAFYEHLRDLVTARDAGVRSGVMLSVRAPSTNRGAA